MLSFVNSVKTNTYIHSFVFQGYLTQPSLTENKDSRMLSFQSPPQDHLDLINANQWEIRLKLKRTLVNIESGSHVVFTYKKHMSFNLNNDCLFCNTDLIDGAGGQLVTSMPEHTGRGVKRRRPTVSSPKTTSTDTINQGIIYEALKS